MKKNKSLKYFLSIFLLILIMFLTFRTIFNNHDINEIIKDVTNIKMKYVITCIALVFVYFLLQGIYMKRNLKILGKEIKLSHGLFYSIVEFFFSGITPSSTGGQPIQLYYMNKDKIRKKKALITLLINTIFFKLIISLFGIGIFIFDHKMILKMPTIFIIFYFIGIIVDAIIVIGGYLLLYQKNILQRILEIIEKIIKKFMKHYDMKIDEVINEYCIEIKTLSKNKLEIFNEFIITFIQRMCMFSISYVVYKAFGLNELNFLEIIIIQISVQTAIEFIPLPGGTGVSEYLLSLFFVTAFGENLAATAMLVTRTFSFYIPLIICGLIILIKYLKDNFIDEKK